MSARDFLLAGTTRPALLAALAIRTELNTLTQIAGLLPDSPERRAIERHLVDLGALCGTTTEVINQGCGVLREVSDGMNGLVALLEHCEDQRLSANDLACLIAPQQRKLCRAIEHVGQIL